MLDALREFAERARAALRASLVFLAVFIPAAVIASQTLAGVTNLFVSVVVMGAYVLVILASAKLARRTYERAIEVEDE